MIKEGKALLEVDGVLYIVAEVRDGEMVPLPLEEVWRYVPEKREVRLEDVYVSSLYVFGAVFGMAMLVLIFIVLVKRL